jgi:hypothetical protein
MCGCVQAARTSCGCGEVIVVDDRHIDESRVLSRALHFLVQTPDVYVKGRVAVEAFRAARELPQPFKTST